MKYREDKESRAYVMTYRTRQVDIASRSMLGSTCAPELKASNQSVLLILNGCKTSPVPFPPIRIEPARLTVPNNLSGYQAWRCKST